MAGQRACKGCFDAYSPQARQDCGWLAAGPRAVAAYDFRARPGTRELSVDKGQGVALRRWVGAGRAWLLCTDERDQSGIVPAAFLTVVQELPAAASLIS